MSTLSTPLPSLIWPRTALAAGATALSIAAALSACSPAQASIRLPAPAVDVPATTGPQSVVLAGGCFWGVQGVFAHVRGVKQVVVGYAGGKQATANYETVSTGTTGHAESVRITFDPKEITYGGILRIFFSVATDPTQVNRQFPDSGTQYRSEVFYANPSQKMVADRYIAQLNRAKVFNHPIATRVDPDTGFFRAEAHHQDYLVRHPEAPYIATFDAPKVAALKTLFPADYRAKPVTAL
ncbi:MAG: peptide-methionine (S)-S-oxide reductase MsrA [Pseudomonadota bacterium]|nr:peptide-methionine (S)-S-oxide reductase MsrA [Pseudomonadota bacterium]